MKELPKECGVCEYNHQEGEFLCCCHKDASDWPGIVPACPICPANGRATWCPLEVADNAVKDINVMTTIAPQINPHSPPGSEWTPLATQVAASGERIEGIIHDEVGECKRCPHNHLYQMITAGSYTYSGEIPCLNCLSDAPVTDTWRERKEAMSQQGGGSIEELEPIEELPIGHCDITVRKKIDEISRKVNILMENF